MKKALKVFVGLHLMIIGCTLTVLGDSPSLRWVTQAGSSGVVQGTTIANDAEGNFLIGGSLSGTAIFGSNILGSIGGSDGFVAKYSPLGICLWAKLMGGGGDDQVTAIAVESSSGNVYACGYYEGSATFGPFSITNAGVNSADVFVTKLAATGEVQWVRRGGGSHANGDFGNGITLDSSGNCYVTGTFSGGSSPGFTATFGSTTLTNRGYSDIFLAKYASDGTPLWAKQAGGNFSDAGNSICLSSLGELYVVGSFQSSATWGNVFATTNLVAGGGNSFDGFLAKYTLAGALDWVVGIGGAFNDFAYEVVPSANDGALVYATYSTASHLQKYGSSGTLEWERVITNGAMTAIASDTSGYSYVTGRFTNVVNLVGTNLPGSAAGDIFLAKYDAVGALVWATSIGSVPHGQARSVVANTSDTVCLTGDFSATATFGGSTLTSGADADVFIAQLGTGVPPAPTTLALQMYPGLSITGFAGRIYRIEASDVLNTNWQILTNVFLPSSPYLWFDTTPGRPANRFYRTVFVP